MSLPDLRKARRWLSAEEIRLLGFGLILLAALLVGNIALARVLPGGEWFFLRWSGARAFLDQQIQFSNGDRGGRMMPEAVLVELDRPPGPYSTEVAQRTQEIVYGRRAFALEYGYVLNDPFFILLLYMPLAFIGDFSVARGIWMVLAEIALMATVMFAIKLSEWEPPRWLYALFLALGLLQYFSLSALVTASPAILLGFLYLAILLALRSFSEELAGALLALVAYQWEVGGLFFLFILFLVLVHRRWAVLAGLGMALFVLLSVSFLIDSDWGLPYIRAVLSDWYRGSSLSLGAILSRWFPEVTLPLGTIVAAVFGILLFSEWVGAVYGHPRRLVWTASLSLAVTPLMGFPIFSANHVVLLLPLVLVLALVWERWPRYRFLRLTLLLLIVVLIPFAMYARVVSVYDPLVNDLIAVLPPIAAIVGLYWMRWWVLRSPRPLFDRLGDLR
jgi:hypothetical protein